jgi:ribonuclease III
MQMLESKIGYHFADETLLQQALTHSSITHEKRSHDNNQRLEFLGDAVLQLILSEHLYQKETKANEGRMTKARAQLVSMRTLAQIARQLGLGSHLIMSHGEESCGGREKEAALADALEAILGAIYLDGGLAEARRVVLHLFQKILGEHSQNSIEYNPKGQLQEILQAIHLDAPTYLVMDEQGPDHDKHFMVQVSWREQILGQGKGRSKKAAEVDAARIALENRCWHA